MKMRRRGSAKMGQRERSMEEMEQEDDGERRKRRVRRNKNGEEEEQAKKESKILDGEVRKRENPCEKG